MYSENRISLVFVGRDPKDPTDQVHIEFREEEGHLVIQGTRAKPLLSRRDALLLGEFLCKVFNVSRPTIRRNRGESLQFTSPGGSSGEISIRTANSDDY